jgi:Kef-type K+ transport system membrane component KefB
MTPFIQLILTLSIILFTARLAGYISTRLGQPAVLGQLVVGILLGPSLLDITHLSFMTDTHLTQWVIELGELGVLFLMFIAGLELHLSELMHNRRVSAFAGTLGVIVPVVLGWLVGIATGYSHQNAFFMGIILGATSISISAQTLIELKVLRSRVGLGLLGAAVLDDVLVILLLSGFLAFTGSNQGLVQFLLAFGRMLLFLALSVAFGLWGIPYLLRKVGQLPLRSGLLTLALVIMLLYGVAAEVIGGLAAITGTFIAGLMFARAPEKNQFEEGLVTMGYAFFVPIFFVSIGLSINLRMLPLNAIWLWVLVLLAAVFGKILGAGLGARIGGMTWWESTQIGIGMISRGEVGLIVANVGLRQGLINNDIFSAVIIMILVTTLITPILLKLAFKHGRESVHNPIQSVETPD